MRRIAGASPRALLALFDHRIRASACSAVWRDYAAYTLHSAVLLPQLVGYHAALDYETFRVLPSLSKKTIRIPDDDERWPRRPARD